MSSDKNKLICVLCNYSCSRNAHLQKHYLSKKHLTNSEPIAFDPNCKFQCKQCNKKYKGQSGLWQHSKVCIAVTVTPPPPIVDEAIIPATSTNDSNNIEGMMIELKKLNDRIEVLSNDINSRHTVPVVNNINNNNSFNINLFLNETCKDAINLDSFIKNLMFELADPKLMIGNYVDGTCNILQRNLDGLPLNKRPLHCMEGEDPNQQLMHIRQDDKWNIGTYVNWLEQIHADDDDDVENKNPIYYALKTIDDEKLKYLGYNHYQNIDYKLQHGRLQREITRPDLKKIVYDRLLKIITLDTEKTE
jgi:Zinc-finger of C2H2 type